MAEAEAGGAGVPGGTKVQLERVLDDMESLGIVTELAGKVLLQQHASRQLQQAAPAASDV